MLQKRKITMCPKHGVGGMDMKKALIADVTGQDGSSLSDFLLEKGYDVHGVICRSSVDFREGAYCSSGGVSVLPPALWRSV